MWSKEICGPNGLAWNTAHFAKNSSDKWNFLNAVHRSLIVYLVPQNYMSSWDFFSWVSDIGNLKKKFISLIFLNSFCRSSETIKKRKKIKNVLTWFWRSQSEILLISCDATLVRRFLFNIFFPWGISDSFLQNKCIGNLELFSMFERNFNWMTHTLLPKWCFMVERGR